MDEATAKTKWCPMLGAQTRQYGVTVFPDSVNCIGSECMAWRELITCFKEGETSASNSELLRREANGEYRVVGGYCGAFGKP